MNTTNRPAISRVDFRPCDGFGAIGRSAALSSPAGDELGVGYGATDDEAVLEALINAGVDYDTAFDLVGATIAGARVVRHD